MSEKKQILLDALLESVKECQIRFGGKSELATEGENVIAKLCARFEDICNHGLKRTSEPASSLNSLKDKVASNIQSLVSVASSSNISNQTQSPWPFIRLHLNRHELERYMLLKHVKTDSGRARAWLRSSLNEHSLERYFHMMINDGSERILQFYEPHAFIIDQERSSMLPQMAAGLSSILFAITIDNEVLNFWSSSTPSLLENGTTDEDILAPKTVKSIGAGASSEEKKKSRNKKKGSSQVISFDDDHEIKATLTKNIVIKHSTSAASTSVSGANSSFTSVSGTNDVDKRELERKVQAALKNHNSYRSPSPSMSITYDDIVHLESNKGILDTGEVSPTDRADTTSLLSIDIGNNGDTSNNSVFTKLTPMKNSEHGALIPLSPGRQDDVMSDDSISIKSFGDDQDYASAMSSMIPTRQPSPDLSRPQTMTSTAQAGHHYGHKRQSSVSSVASATSSTLSREDLKHALLSVMERKEELQDQCH